MAFLCYFPETLPLSSLWKSDQAFLFWLCCCYLSWVSSPAANGLGRLWVCYDVYLNNDSPGLWKSKRLRELLLLVLLQKSEERDVISLEKCGLRQEDGQRWWGRALQQMKSLTFRRSRSDVNKIHGAREPHSCALKHVFNPQFHRARSWNSEIWNGFPKCHTQ